MGPTNRVAMKNFVLWAAPPLFCLAVYWPGLMSWFQKDDFAWLGLRMLVHNGRDLWWALFAPLAQGTIRTWSERVFFMAFSSVFGLHALPFRVLVFITQFVNLILLNSIAWKLTGSRAVGFWAAILWTANSALATGMSWTSAYNEILCSFFLLLAFWLFLRYVETQDRRYYVAQFIVFLLGFGALETNLVYPAFVGAYALAVNRRYLGKVFPLVLVSASYLALHVWAAPFPASGPYRTYFDHSMLSTLWMYWKNALGPSRLGLLGIPPSLWRSSVSAVLILGLAVFLIGKLRRGEWLAAVFPVWFLAAIAPVLPLRDHFTELYLTIPTIGLSIWGAWALVSGWRRGGLSKWVPVAIVCIYLIVSVPIAIVESREYYKTSQETRGIVLPVIEAGRDKTVLLSGVSDELFWSVIYYRPFWAF